MVMGIGKSQKKSRLFSFLVCGILCIIYQKFVKKKRKVWELGVRPTKETHEQTAGQATNRRSAAAFSLRNRFKKSLAAVFC